MFYGGMSRKIVLKNAAQSIKLKARQICRVPRRFRAKDNPLQAACKGENGSLGQACYLPAGMNSPRPLMFEITRA